MDANFSLKEVTTTMRVSVFGAGYVGLVTAICLAEIGHHVVCVDIDPKKITDLNQGIAPIYEEGLQPLLEQHLQTQQIQFTDDPEHAIKHGDVQFIAVGTPLNAQGEVNLDYIYQVATQIAQHMQQDCTVVMKSTVPPGTAHAVTKHIAHILDQRSAEYSFDVASNPEFLQEGTAIQQFMYPDRIIIGAENINTIQTLHDLYQPILKTKEQFVIMNKPSAELTKYAANSLLATKVSFMNEISQIAEQVGANIDSVKQGVGMDYRINPRFLNAGCGFGGSCFPKDIMTLIATARSHQVKPYVLESVIQRNLDQQQLLFRKVHQYFNGNLNDKTIALWGLTFKPNTDDIRCSTSRILVELFCQAGTTIRAYDPLGMDNFAKLYPDNQQLIFCSSPLDAIDQADVLVIATEWPEFKRVPLKAIEQRLNYNAIFDGRNIFHEEVHKHNIEYFGIGVEQRHQVVNSIKT